RRPGNRRCRVPPSRTTSASTNSHSAERASRRSDCRTRPSRINHNSAMTRPAVLLVAPPVVGGQGWWANRIANKPHLASLGGYVRDIADPRTLELDIDATAPLPDLLEALDFALIDDVALVGISC